MSSPAQPGPIPATFSPLAARPAGRGAVRAAIADAAAATGTSFDYLLAQAKIESALDPQAHAATSSARGLYQFTQGTWLRAIEAHGAEHGLGWAQQAIASGALRDPSQRAAILALRDNPDISARMAGELAGDNRAVLTARLGRDPDAAELYLAHFLGADGAGRFLDTLASDPGASAAALLPKAAAANRGIFFGAGGAPRSVAGVMDLLRAKVTTAMTAPDEAGAGGDAWADAGGFDPTIGGLPVAAATAPEAPTGGPIAQEFAVTAAAAAPAHASMAETLGSAFGLAGGGDAVPAHVRSAYGRLAALGF